jgi:hypothetical protein
MLRIALISLAAAAAVALGASSVAAKTNLNVVVGVPAIGIGVGPAYGYPIYQPAYIGSDCYQVKVWTGKYKSNGKKKYAYKTYCD